jgi:hypothetical protein
MEVELKLKEKELHHRRNEEEETFLREKARREKEEEKRRHIADELVHKEVHGFKRELEELNHKQHRRDEFDREHHEKMEAIKRGQHHREKAEHEEAEKRARAK